ncbi:MAG TPA: extracellular solute-binding protein [Vicinamibacteria bacterium]
MKIATARLAIGTAAVALAALVFEASAFAQGGSKPLQMWVGSETDASYYRKMAELYRARMKPGFAAEVNAYGYTEMPDKLAVAIKTGANPPDIVQLDEIFFSLYLRGEVPFLDLTSRIKSAGLEAKILKQRQALFAFGGKTYGLPQSVSAIVLYYRHDLVTKAGLQPSDFETWEKFRAAGKKAKASGPSLLSLDWSYFEILLRQRGVDLFDDAGAPLLDSKAAVETLEWLVAIAKEGVGLKPDRGTIFEPAFFAGDVANNETMAILGADWYGLDMIQGLAPATNGQWRAMPLPGWDASPTARRTSVFAGEGLLVYRDTKRADESWDFIRFVMEDIDANVERYLQGNCFTAYQPAWSDPRLKRPEPFFGGQSLAKLFTELAPQVPLERASPYKAELVNLWREKYWSAVIHGVMPPAKALQEMQKELLRPR